MLGPSLQLIVSVFCLDGLDLEGTDLSGRGDCVEQVVSRVVIGQDDLTLIWEVKQGGGHGHQLWRGVLGL